MEIYKGLYWYSLERDNPVNMIAIPVDRVREIQKMNYKGEKPHKIIDNDYDNIDDISFNNVVGNDSLTRFEKKKDKKGKRNKKGKTVNKDEKRK